MGGQTNVSKSYKYIIINHGTCGKGNVQVPQWFLIKPMDSLVSDCRYLYTLCSNHTVSSHNWVLVPFSRTFCLPTPSSTWWNPLQPLLPGERLSSLQVHLWCQCLRRCDMRTLSLGWSYPPPFNVFLTVPLITMWPELRPQPALCWPYSAPLI